MVEGMRLSQNDVTERETETDRKSQIQMETDRRRSGRGRLNGGKQIMDNLDRQKFREENCCNQNTWGP